jgi:hypothetical protein
MTGKVLYKMGVKLIGLQPMIIIHKNYEQTMKKRRRIKKSLLVKFSIKTFPTEKQ